MTDTHQSEEPEQPVHDDEPRPEQRTGSRHGDLDPQEVLRDYG